MQIQDMTLLYDYNDWANKRILSATAGFSQEQFVTPTAHNYGTLRATLLHTLDTEYGWRFLCQFNKITEDLTEADVPTLDAMVKRWHEEESAMRSYLAGLNDDSLTRIVSYTVNDKTRNRVLWHCLLHIVNHGTQHRSEAAAILTSLGQSPGDLDFTVFLSEKQI
jgi:uncharacterized damage-inducible protein DinB